jgi:hypothetical protein
MLAGRMVDRKVQMKGKGILFIEGTAEARQHNKQIYGNEEYTNEERSVEL